MLKLYGSLASPYVRKIRVLIEETGLTASVSFETVSLSPLHTRCRADHENPLGKIPLLELEDGSLLYDSRVISEFLDTCHSEPRFLPEAGPSRWDVLRRQALAAHPDDPVDLGKNWPKLQGWFEQFNQRPAMQATLPVA